MPDLEQDAVTANYKDGLHTDGPYSYIVAQAFVRAAMCSNAASILQFDVQGQLFSPFCSQYGVRQDGMMSRTRVKAPVPASNKKVPFCFAIKSCTSPDRDCLPLCKAADLRYQR
jgi:hypothetical protein